MNINYKTALLCTVSVFLLASCGPKKEEKAPPAPEQMEQKAGPKAPAVTPAPAASEKKPDTSLMYPEHPGEKLTPEQQTKEINEDNVMNPIPG